MNLNNKPKVKEGNFYRDESNDKLLIIPEKLDQNYSIIVNNTGKEILNLCNGKNTIANIIEILKIKFDETNSEKITNDVISFLYNMLNQQVIHEFKEEPMYTGIDINLNDNYKIHRCGEGDIDNIISTINSIRQEKYESDSSEKLEEVILTNARNKKLAIHKIQRLKLRNNLFKFAEEFYILIDKKNSKNVSLLAYSDISNKNIQMYEVSIFEYLDEIPSDIITMFISKSIDNLKNEICTECSKIKFYSNSNIKNDFMMNLFKKNNFTKVGYLKNEYGKGIDKLIFEKYLA